MGDPRLDVDPVWVTEHYWPGVADELVLAQAQRLAHVLGWLTTIVMPAEQTAFGLYAAPGTDDVRRALAHVGSRAATISPGWRLRPSTLLHHPAAGQVSGPSSRRP
jgi:hypothetical protein